MITAAASPQRRRDLLSGSRRSVAFTCPYCKRSYGDPLFHGPAGHAPPAMCYDCWTSEWGQMELVIARGGDWKPLDAALFLLCRGFSHQEAADLIGVHRNTLFAWIRELRRRPGLLPEWIVQAARARRRWTLVQRG